MQMNFFFSLKSILSRCLNFQNYAKHLLKLFPPRMMTMQISSYHNLIACIVFIDPDVIKAWIVQKPKGCCVLLTCTDIQDLRFGRTLLARWTYLWLVQAQEVRYLVLGSIWRCKTPVSRSSVLSLQRVQLFQVVHHSETSI